MRVSRGHTLIYLVLAAMLVMLVGGAAMASIVREPVDLSRQSTQELTSPANDIALWTSYAQTFVAPDFDDAVANVDGRTISRAMFNQQLIMANASLSFMTQLENSSLPYADRATLKVPLLQRYGVRTAALGASILRSVEDSELVRRGIVIDKAKIDQGVSGAKGLVAEGKAPAITAAIDILGEERYWNEVAPAAYQRALAMQALRQAVLSESDAQTEDERERVWEGWRVSVLQTATVSVVDHEFLAGIDIQQAIKFIQESLTMQ